MPERGRSLHSLRSVEMTGGRGRSGSTRVGAPSSGTWRPETRNQKRATARSIPFPMARLLILLFALGLLAGCSPSEAPPSEAPATDPSPAAMAEPPTAEALEPSVPPLAQTRARFREAMDLAAR